MAEGQTSANDTLINNGSSSSNNNNNIPAVGADKATNIPVRLVSRTSQHAIPATKFMIPSEWRRFHLSELINKVLGNTESVPFDFIVHEELLRSSLGEWTKAKGLTEETVLEIEYVESILPPKYLSSFEQEDWISDIDLSQKGLFLTSAYDKNIRIFSAAGAGLQTTLVGHTLPVLSTCWLPSTSSGESTTSFDRAPLIASGGMDRVIRVWQAPALANDSAAATSSSSSTSVANTTHALSLHTAAVSSVRAGKTLLDGSKMPLISASWDGLVGYWEIDPNNSVADDQEEEQDEDEDMPRQKKKRRTGGNSLSAASLPKIKKVHPTLIMNGHQGQISRAIFDSTSTTASRAFSFGSDDHTVKSWDLDAAGLEVSSKRAPEKALLDGDQLADNRDLLVTANSDRSISLWDLRDSANTIISLNFANAHGASVASVSTNPLNSMLFASAGMDGSSKIWDVRSNKQALFNLPRRNGAKGKLLTVRWDGELVAMGGEDSRLELFQSKGVAA